MARYMNLQKEESLDIVSVGYDVVDLSVVKDVIYCAIIF